MFGLKRTLLLEQFCSLSVALSTCNILRAYSIRYRYSFTLKWMSLLGTISQQITTTSLNYITTCHSTVLLRACKSNQIYIQYIQYLSHLLSSIPTSSQAAMISNYPAWMSMSKLRMLRCLSMMAIDARPTSHPLACNGDCWRQHKSHQNLLYQTWQNLST